MEKYAYVGIWMLLCLLVISAAPVNSIYNQQVKHVVFFDRSNMSFNCYQVNTVDTGYDTQRYGKFNVLYSHSLDVSSVLTRIKMGASNKSVTGFPKALVVESSLYVLGIIKWECDFDEQVLIEFCLNSNAPLSDYNMYKMNELRNDIHDSGIELLHLNRIDIIPYVHDGSSGVLLFDRKYRQLYKPNKASMSVEKVATVFDECEVEYPMFLNDDIDSLLGIEPHDNCFDVVLIEDYKSSIIFHYVSDVDRYSYNIVDQIVHEPTGVIVGFGRQWIIPNTDTYVIPKSNNYPNSIPFVASYSGSEVVIVDLEITQELKLGEKADLVGQSIEVRCVP
jgi:hypothetical protein